MLHQLIAHGNRMGLASEPGFSAKQVRWSLQFKRDGTFVGVIELGDVDSKKNRGATFLKCPHLTQPEIKRGGKGCRHFLVDNLAVVTQFGASDDPNERRKHQYFLNQMHEAATIEPILKAVATALTHDFTRTAIHDQLLAAKARATENATFAVMGEDPSFLVDRDSWHQWWRDFRTSLQREARTDRVRCLLSGEIVEPAATHPKVKGLSDVGGISMGDVVPAFKQESFGSYGFSQAANAPMSEEMAAAYPATLNHLLRDPDASKTLAGTKVVHWFKRAIPLEDDPLPWLFDPPERIEADAVIRANRTLSAIESGGRPDLANNEYYALTLSANSGRVMVRDWAEGQFVQLLANIIAWFEDLSIVVRDGKRLANDPKMLAVLGSSVRELKDLSAPLIAATWQSAIRKRPIPKQLMANVLHRVRSAVLGDEPIQHAGAGLLKCYLRRAGDHNMTTHLNESHPHPAYHCGRLLAVFATIQYKALGDVGASVVQRNYGAASATPGLVLGRLNRLAQFHLDKLDRGLRHFWHLRLASVWARIEKIPNTLSLDEQSLFALGYYHETAHRFTSSKTDSDEAAKETSNE